MAYNVVLAGGVLLSNCDYRAIVCLVAAVVTSIDSSSSFTLSWDMEAPSGTSFTVWYSTGGHESYPSSPSQGALVVSGLKSTSVTIILPDSDNSCRPYYVWIAGITPNGQRGPYSKRKKVEMCQASGGVRAWNSAYQCSIVCSWWYWSCCIGDSKTLWEMLWTRYSGSNVLYVRGGQSPCSNIILMSYGAVSRWQLLLRGLIHFLTNYNIIE